MAPTYKLTYFNIKGLAEPIRMILKYKGVDFEDVRINHEEWATLKPKQKWGVLPVLSIDGVEYGQSTSILRFLGRKFGLAGSNEREAFLCDEYADALKDLSQELRPLRTETDEVKKAELKKKLIEITLPQAMARFEGILKDNGGKWMVGGSITWFDILLAQTLDGLEGWLQGFKASPGLSAFRASIFAIPQIQDWINTRPKTDY